MATTSPTDEQVLADPGDYTVDEVIDVFSRSTPEQVAAAQGLERDGRNRKGVVEYTAPALEPSADPDAPRFARERLLDPNEGEAIVGAKYSHIVGALHGDNGADFTVDEVRAKIDVLMNRPVEIVTEA